MKLKYSNYCLILISIVSIYSIRSSNVDELNPQKSFFLLNKNSKYQYVPYIEENLKFNECEKINLKLCPVKNEDCQIYLNIIEKSTNEQIGNIIFYIKDSIARLQYIYLEEEYQGKGLGKLALIDFYSLMDKLGISNTTCVLQSETKYAANLYLSVGMRFRSTEFKKIAEFDSFDYFLNDSSISKWNPIEMFRIKNTPFNSSKSDQEKTFWISKNQSII